MLPHAVETVAPATHDTNCQSAVLGTKMKFPKLFDVVVKNNAFAQN